MGCSTFSPRVSPDGKHLARIYRCPGSSGVVMLSDWNGNNVTDYQVGNASDVEWSTDGNSLFVRQLDGSRISRLDPADRLLHDLVRTDPGGELLSLKVSPDGKSIVYGQLSANGSVNLERYDFSTNAVDRLTTDGASSF